MIAEFTAHNTALVVPEQGIDTSTANPAARLQLNVLGAVAEFEREIIRERVNDGIAAAKARGVRFGRPRALDAHRGDIARLRTTGLSCQTIAMQLDIPVGSVFQVIREFRLANLEKAA
jgi:DNA invertase Pin-like site-specific DNA recombinase